MIQKGGKKYFDDWLKYFSGFEGFITLICKWRVLAVLKPFNPLSSYNLCFPRKKMVEWFGDYQVSQRSMEMELPPNLNTEKNWMGLPYLLLFQWLSIQLPSLVTFQKSHSIFYAISKLKPIVITPQCLP